VVQDLIPGFLCLGIIAVCVMVGAFLVYEMRGMRADVTRGNQTLDSLATVFLGLPAPVLAPLHRSPAQQAVEEQVVRARGVREATERGDRPGDFHIVYRPAKAPVPPSAMAPEYGTPGRASDQRALPARDWVPVYRDGSSFLSPGPEEIEVTFEEMEAER